MAEVGRRLEDEPRPVVGAAESGDPAAPLRGLGVSVPFAKRMDTGRTNAHFGEPVRTGGHLGDRRGDRPGDPPQGARGEKEAGVEEALERRTAHEDREEEAEPPSTLQLPSV